MDKFSHQISIHTYHQTTTILNLGSTQNAEVFFTSSAPHHPHSPFQVVGAANLLTTEEF